jgi:predicted ATP-dependent endonuclease of OLD family
MKITVQNLGIIEHAQLELGDLTLICGSNNTGKTYVTYAIFGFLTVWRNVLQIDVSEEVVNQLLNIGVVNISLLEYIDKHKSILAQASRAYSEDISETFAVNQDRFKDTQFKIELDIDADAVDIEYSDQIGSADSDLRFFSLTKNKGNFDVVVTLLTERKDLQIPKEIIKRFIGDSIKNIIFSKFFPRPFIASAERTGAAIFHKELNFARNRLLSELHQVEKETDRIELLFKEGYSDYAIPIKANVEFVRTLASVFKRKSQLSQENSGILDDFSNIIGGQYTVSKNDEIYYTPNSNKKLKLAMDESSSSVRSLLDIGFYLKHIAKKGDLLMIDEPELNLHPENQRRVARLIAKLVNYGIKVFVTTHSDYIIKELNTLIMLNSDKPHIKEIAAQEGYQLDELLNPSQIKAYIAREDLVKLNQKSRRTRCRTLVTANIDLELGIEISSFDTEIDKMNRIQEAIVYGEEL